MASTSSPSSSKFPPTVYNPRRHVNVHAEHVSDVSNTEYPGHYPGEDHSWDLGKFKKELTVEVKRLSQRSVEFDLRGVDASIANALRRILIAEVPTIAIEHVYVWNNTSVIQDEVLAHRIGLVPLNIDPLLLDVRTPTSVPNDRNTIVFKLSKQCTRNPKGTKGGPDEYINEYVKSGDLAWIPQGEQEEVFSDGKKPGPTNPDIVLAKLRPGHEIEMELHAIKGLGKEHAKWSPVATASYRLHPLFIMNPSKPIPPHLAEKFASCFSPGVVTIGRDGSVSIEEKNMRKDSISREVLRHEEFQGCVEIKRVRDWFIFNVESEGPYAPERLMPEAVRVMRSKIASIKKAAQALMSDGGDAGENTSVTAGGDVEMGES